jgi:hypothetical protein
MDVGMTFSSLALLALLIVLVVVPTAFGVWSSARGRWAAFVAAGLLAAGSFTLVTLVRLYSRPRCFEISSEGMRIVWPGRTRKLPRAAFGEMREVTDTELGPLHRRFGVGGLFGCFGWFTSEYMGNMDAYITRREGMVYIRLKNRRPLLLTPKDSKGFLQALGELTDGADRG